MNSVSAFRRFLDLEFKAMNVISTFMTIAVPAVMLIGIMWGIIYLDSTLPRKEDKALHFKAYQNQGKRLDDLAAVEILSVSKFEKIHSTASLESPVYISIPVRSFDEAEYFYMPGGFIYNVRCWDDKHRMIGEANRDSGFNWNGMMRIATGFAWPVNLAAGSPVIYCEIKSDGHQQLTVYGYTRADLQGVSDRYHRIIGTLDGGMLMMIVIMLITAVAARTKLYAVFALWALASWRLTEQLVGTGADFLTVKIPAQYVLPVGLFTIFMFLAANVALFIEMQGKEFEKPENRWKLQLIHLGFVLEFLFLVFSSLTVFIYATWVISFLLITWSFYLHIELFRLAFKEGRNTYVLFSSGLMISLFASLGLMLSIAAGSNAFGPEWFGVIQGVVTTLLATSTIAIRLHSESRQRQKLANELQLMFESTPVPLFSATATGRLLLGNRAFWQLAKRDPSNTGGHLWIDLFGEGGWGTVSDTLKRADGEAVRVETNIGGERKFLELQIGTGDVEVSGCILDVTHQVERERNQQYLTFHDPLTGALNAKGLERELDQSSLARRGEAVVVALDLFRMEAINHLFGHGAGDQVLIEVVRRLKAAVPEDGLVCRPGGDQFLVVVESSLSAAESLADRLVYVISSRPVTSGDLSVRVQACAGFALLTGGLAESALQAERACHEAVRLRRRVVSANSDSPLQATSRAVRNVAARMKEIAPSFRDFRVGVRNVLSIGGQGLLAVEVVPQLPSDHSGQYWPLELIELAAEMSSTLVDLDVWRLEQAVALARRHSGAGLAFAASITAATIANADAAKRILRAAQDGIDVGNRIIVRISESAAAFDPDATREIVARLSNYQIRVICSGVTAASSCAWLSLGWAGVELDSSLMGSAGPRKNAGLQIDFVRVLARLAQEASVELWVTGAVAEPHLQEARNLGASGYRDLEVRKLDEFGRVVGDWSQ